MSTMPVSTCTFPTRRSSDLGARRIEVLSVSLAGADRPEGGAGRIAEADCAGTPPGAHSASATTLALARWGATVHHPRVLERLPRSEEHTSELQSRENLVCRL